MHNLAGALTAVPLAIAFALGRVPTGWAGLRTSQGMFIVVLMAGSAVFAAGRR